MGSAVVMRDVEKSRVGRMLFLKSCPRCQGDMYLEKDYYGIYKECLQCGNVLDLDEKSLKEHARTVRAA